MTSNKPITEKFSNDLKHNLEGLVSYLLDKKPEDVIPYMMQYLEDKKGTGAPPLSVQERNELHSLRH